MLDTVATRFREQSPAVDFWTLRLVDERCEGLAVRQGVLQPITNYRSTGAMITVIDRGGVGYAATSDLSFSGLAMAATKAREWAWGTANRGLVATGDLPRPHHRGSYRTVVERPWEDLSLEDKIALLHTASQRLKIHPQIVDWQAALGHRQSETLLVNSAGAYIEQVFNTINPGLYAVANEGTNTQKRTYGGIDHARQGGLEQLEVFDFPNRAEAVAEEAIVLLHAPNCPSKPMDLLLMPAQMALQIHESIGHPLELDRILGDERNYAGTSFVSLDMFGTYRYGSEHLNVTFDPTLPEQLASYAFDDEGTPAERQFIIRDGILQRPLGGACSQARGGIEGVANARACDWNRPPIDRMANLNLEPGDSSLEDLIGSIENGIYMDTNRSWSIDDSRNKFQFGCEYARLIRNGELCEVVRDPNYRGISATFWRNLTKVGGQGTFRVMGVNNCGKGEPNQMIHVGHAAPACVFRDVDVFGGA